MIKLSEIIEATGGSLVMAGSDETYSGVSSDSRTIKPGELFVAIPGERYDGHQFLEQAIQSGAKGLLVSNAQVSSGIPTGVAVLLVGDTVEALGQIARWHRRKFDIPVVAVTGSCGKTTVKELMASILSTRYRVLKSDGTENNLIGVPKTLLKLSPHHEVVVLEMGTNRPGEIRRLSEIAEPTIGVITQIAPSHLEGLKDIQGVLKEKIGLLDHLRSGGSLVLNGEDPYLQKVTSASHSVYHYGFSQKYSVYAGAFQVMKGGIQFLLNAQTPIQLPLLGQHNVLNALASIKVGELLGVEALSIRRGLLNVKLPAGRLRILEKGGIQIIDDCYNSNPASLTAALVVLRSWETSGRRIAVVGDMLELGECASDWHRRMGRVIARSEIDLLIAVGKYAKELVLGAEEEGMSASRRYCCGTLYEAQALLTEKMREGDVILIKGSRAMRMERLIDCFHICCTA